MKLFFLFFTAFIFHLQVVGQVEGALDSERLESLPHDSLYEVLKSRARDLNNSPSLRLQYLDFGLALAAEEGNDVICADFSANSAVVYAEVGMNQEALKFGLNALDYAKKTPGTRDDIWSLYRLSDIHAILHDTSQALMDAHRALTLSLERDTVTEVGWSYSALGEAHRNLGNLDSAVYYYQQCLATFEPTGFVRGIKYAHQNLGLTLTAQEKYEEAYEEFQIATQSGGKEDALYLLEQGEAMLHIIVDQYSLDSGIAFGHQMIVEAEQGDYPTWQRVFKAKLADLYRQKSDWETALQYYREADALEEAQTGERIRLQSSVIDHQYSMQLLQAEHEIQTQENRNQIIIWISTILVLGLLGIFAIIQIINNKQVKKINAQLSEQNDHLDELIKEKDIWIHLMAHDLKTPLNAISGLLDILKSDDLPPQVKDQVMQNISKSIHNGTELISQLLEISRLESNEDQADIRETNINKLVEETEQNFKPLAEGKGITLQTEMPQTPIELPTDPVYAQRILENLVSNAIKFSPSSKNILLVLASNVEDVTIDVIDQGPGISAEDQQNLFQKFKKLSARPTGGESSTGLGLSIVKHLADRVGAQILVKSIPGEGATFTLSMPKIPNPAKSTK